MEVSSIEHINFGDATDFQPDLCITCLTHESRGTTVLRLLSPGKQARIALVPSREQKSNAYQENLKFLTGNQFELIRVGSAVPDLQQYLPVTPGRPCRVLVDYTSMPKRWYFQILRWFNDMEEEPDQVVARFAYSAAAFSDPKPAGRIRGMEVLTQGGMRQSGNRKSALILGLGHEKKIYETVHRKIKPDLTFLFYADPPVDKRFVDALFVNNHALIHATPIRNLVAYPIGNAGTIYEKLMENILPLRGDHDIQIAPMGPKIFSLSAMLVHLRYPDIAIAYPVYKQGKNLLNNHEPFGNPVITDVRFESGE